MAKLKKEGILFDMQPMLTGNYVVLRPLYESDKEALYKVASDPLIWEQHPDKGRHTRDGFNKFFSESIHSGGTLIIFDSKTGAVIGSSRYSGYGNKDDEVEIGWTFLARSHWGGKFNGELKRLMIEHAFKFVSSVVFYIDPDNQRSQRSVEKIGAVRAEYHDNNGRVIFRVQNPMVKIDTDSHNKRMRSDPAKLSL